MPGGGPQKKNPPTSRTSSWISSESAPHWASSDGRSTIGGSWGSGAPLAYTERFPNRVTEIILFGVTTGRHKEFDWSFRGGLADLFPEQWEQLRDAVRAALRDGDIIEAYCRLLHDPDASIREQAALAWCTWESATPAWPPAEGLSPRFRDPAFRMAFARIVTHYVRHNAWLDDNILLRDAAAIADIPGIMVNGRFDLQAPIGWAYDLKRIWPRAKLVIVDDAGHDASNASITQELVRRTDQFASRAD